MGGRSRGDEKVAYDGLRTHCIRCGTCCKNNPPTLHIQDISILKDNIIMYSDLITYRKGEYIYDNINKKLINLDEEIVKIKTKGESRECIFYDAKDKSCKIYESRPIECRMLKCWDNTEFLKFYQKDRVTRFHIIKKDSAMGEIIHEHEKKTSMDNVLKLYYEYKNTKQDKLRKKINSIISYDNAVREFIQQRTGAKKELDFLFGRPVLEILKDLGW